MTPMPTITVFTTAGHVLWTGRARDLRHAAQKALQQCGHLMFAALQGADLHDLDLRGANLRHASLVRANLSGCNLSDSDLRDTDLERADLRGALLSGAVMFLSPQQGDHPQRQVDLTGTDLSRARLAGTDPHSTAAGRVPVVPDLHARVAAAVQHPEALSMATWHCGTTHCRAGWIVTLAGEEGEALEREIGTNAAAALISLASEAQTFQTEAMFDFYAEDQRALNDIRRLAQRPG